MSEDTNNPVYKLATDNLQLNVLIRSIFNTKVSQGSVATRLRCIGIFNDQFISQSLLSPMVKELWKSVNILLKLWERIESPVFLILLTHGVYVSGTLALWGCVSLLTVKWRNIRFVGNLNKTLANNIGCVHKLVCVT